MLNSLYKTQVPTMIKGVQKYDWKGWLTPNLCNIQGHQGGTFFRFTKYNNDYVGLHYGGRY